MPVLGSNLTMPNDSSTRSTPPRVPVWGSDFQSVVRLSRAITADYGRRRTLVLDAHFHLPFLLDPSVSQGPKVVPLMGVSCMAERRPVRWLCDDGAVT